VKFALASLGTWRDYWQSSGMDLSDRRHGHKQPVFMVRKPLEPVVFVEPTSPVSYRINHHYHGGDFAASLKATAQGIQEEKLP
jgi:hypothetical protein